MYFYSSIKIGRFTDKIVAWFNWMTWLHFIKTKKLYQETVFRLLHQFLSWNKEYCHFWILHKLGCWKMYKNTFLGILEAEKSQKPKCSSKIMNSMSAWMDFMFFYVHFGFCDFSASKMPRKMILYIFQQPSLCRIQK